MSSSQALPSSPLNSRGNRRADPLAFNTAGALTSDGLSDGRMDDRSTDLSGSRPGALGSRTSDVYNRNNALNIADPHTQMDGMSGRSKTKQRPRVDRIGEIPPIEPIIDALGESVRQTFQEFLLTYYEEPLSGSPDPDGDGIHNESYYLEQIKRLNLGEHKSTTLYVDFSHVLRWNEDLARSIVEYYQRFGPYLRRALRELIADYDPDYLFLNAHAAGHVETALIPRDFFIGFYNLPLVSGIRDLRMNKIGDLISISGTVTRTSEVRPELHFGSFICNACRTPTQNVEQQFKYTEPIMCANGGCNNRTSWHLNIQQSRFVDWQKVRIQENANEIPTGSMPRSLDVILRADIVEKAKAGDKCVFTGTFIVVPDVSQMGIPGVNAQMQRESAGGRIGDLNNQGVTGLKLLGVRDLTYKTAFLACQVESASDRKEGAILRDDDNGWDRPETASHFLDGLKEEEREELIAMAEMPDIYQRLVKSIAPTVYGHDIVKRGILLQLLGGVHKQTNEGIHLRGDLNICIVGDPSTSKSQFLKYVSSFLPRAIYTSGKASSAAGLTAAVVRDEETGEFTIEAGALMLADNGICCIDEFDKMDISDQVAIHEAMEQQTISIAKAGLQATLNARTSILAAANPVGGRYNRKMTLKANVAMSAPIMSRFDLFFVVLDECNENVDMNIAKHIINVHRFKEQAIAPEFNTESVQRFIKYAKTFDPKLTPEASDVLVEKYRLLRQDDSSFGSALGGKNSYRITVRQLESLIRLSEAIARVHCVNYVLPEYVKEAYSLLKQSIIHVEKDDIDFDDDDDDEEEEKSNNDRDFTRQTARMVARRAQEDDSQMASSSSALDTQDESMREIGAGTTVEEETTTFRPGTSAKPKIRLTYDQYMEILNMIILRVSEVERSTYSGMDREELIEWYLGQKEDQLESLEELAHERQLIDKVLNRLVKENYLLEIRGDMTQETESNTEGGANGAAESIVADSIVTDASSSRRLIMIHPTIDVESIFDQGSLV